MSTETGRSALRTLGTELKAQLFPTLERIVRRLVESYQPPDCIVLFGSYAYGEPHRGSDVDLLIIKDTLAPDRNAEVRRHLGELDTLPLQLFVLTPQELRDQLRRRNVFWADVLRKGQPLYSRWEWVSFLEEVEYLMATGESLYSLDWLEWANQDLAAVRALLDTNNITNAAYHLQQVIEKILKAFLLKQGWALERTHDLKKLLDEAIKHKPELETFRPLCKRADEFLVVRYPVTLAQPPTKDELEQLLPQAQALFQRVEPVVQT
jgi:HEPN domain-containing protein/predicted nucleotidyltransferase